MHLKGICHRDIKPDNLIIETKNKILKIMDFNVSK